MQSPWNRVEWAPLARNDLSEGLTPFALMPPTTPPTEIVAYLALFATVGFSFVFASLLLGWFLRADTPTPTKLETYECGEPAIGPGTVQFDLRFYVVALVFLIFEVEVALFFPPAVIFGKAAEARNIAERGKGTGRNTAFSDSLSPFPFLLGPLGANGRRHGGAGGGRARWKNRVVAGLVAFRSAAVLADLGVFFAVVLVGFAFVWRRGDLDWVRAVRHPATPAETAAWMARSQRNGT